MNYIFINNNYELIKFATAENKRILPLIDLEYLGKKIRQKSTNCWFSDHSLENISSLKNFLPEKKIIVRINPLNENSKNEINDVILRGANYIMLPMFRTRNELVRFLDLVDGRAEPYPLFETSESLLKIENILAGLDIKKLHIGLNDLRIDLGNKFIFETIYNGFLDKPINFLKKYNYDYGIGGIARSGEGLIPPEILLGEYVRLGSKCAILSQTFHRNCKNISEMNKEFDFKEEINLIDNIFQKFLNMNESSLELNRKKFNNKVIEILNR